MVLGSGKRVSMQSSAAVVNRMSDSIKRSVLSNKCT